MVPIPPLRTERRQWQRLPLCIPVFVHGVDKAGREIIEYTTFTNISAGGAKILLRSEVLRYLRKPSFLLEIPYAISQKKKVPGAAQRSIFRARIITISSGEADLVALGLKFSKPLIKEAGTTGSKASKSGANLRLM
jgi:hypothetical protein